MKKVYKFFIISVSLLIGMIAFGIVAGSLMLSVWNYLLTDTWAWFV